MLNDSQLRLLAETLANVGIVFFGSFVIPFFIEEFFSPRSLLLGLTLAGTCWLASLLIIKQTKL